MVKIFVNLQGCLQQSICMYGARSLLSYVLNNTRRLVPFLTVSSRTLKLREISENEPFSPNHQLTTFYELVLYALGVSNGSQINSREKNVKVLVFEA